MFNKLSSFLILAVKNAFFFKTIKRILPLPGISRFSLQQTIPLIGIRVDENTNDFFFFYPG